MSTNGAVFTKDKDADEAWTASIQGTITDCAPLADVFTQLAVDRPVPGPIRAQTVEDAFVYCLTERTALFTDYLAAFTGWCA